MTKLKGLFLGSAAAILAVTGAQAADPPAEVWDYVRICDAYGTKYYYIPQTETCLRISGHMQWRAQWGHFDDDFRGRGFNESADDVDDTTFDLRGRGRINIIAQEETEWGTLFGRLELEFTQGGEGVGVTSNRIGTDDNSTAIRHAYLQIAGITAGNTDVLMNFGQGGGPNYLTIAGDGGASRNQLIHYTVPFGNGFSIAAGFEESDNTDREGGVVFGTTVANGGDDVPDFAARLRYEAGWGTAQASGIVRHVEGYRATFGTDDEIGWAARAGLRINLDFLPNGGSIGGQFTYTSGASNWAGDFAPDAYWNATGTDIDTVETWAVYGALEVGVTPSLSAGIWGGYVDVDNVNSLLTATGTAAAAEVHQTESWWNIGTTLTWTPLTNLVIGLDAHYENHEDVSRSVGGVFTDTDFDNWQVAIGMQRNF